MSRSVIIHLDEEQEAMLSRMLSLLNLDAKVTIDDLLQIIVSRLIQQVVIGASGADLSQISAKAWGDQQAQVLLSRLHALGKGSSTDDQ